MSQFNFPGNATTAVMLAAASCANTAAATGTGVDLKDYGTGTGTLDGKIQDSANNSSFADVSGLTFTQSTTTADIQSLVVQSKQVRRYIRYVGTIVTGPQVVGVSMSGVKKSV